MAFEENEALASRFHVCIFMLGGLAAAIELLATDLVIQSPGWHQEKQGRTKRARCIVHVRTHGLPLSIPQQAADCRAVMQHLGIERVHLAGLSYGGAILLQFAVDFPEATQTLTLMEPSLPAMKTAPPEFQEAVTKAMSLREAGEKAAALDTVFKVVCGPDYAAVFDQKLPPGWFERWVADAETLFQHDLPALGNWKFTAEDAARISAPVLNLKAANTYDHERYQALQSWIPHAERAVVPNATHCMLLAKPADAADHLVTFISRHPPAN